MYFPKNQIIIDQYTNGKEYSLESSEEEYIGYYYITGILGAFTGKTPDDKTTQKLIPYVDNSQHKYNIVPAEYDKLDKLGEIPNIKRFKSIIPYYPFPSIRDINNNFMVRNIVYKRNNYYIIEVNNEIYESITLKNGKYDYIMYGALQFKLLKYV